MSKYADIIERLRKAEGADAWLSNLIAVATGVYPADSIEAIAHDVQTIWFHEGHVQDPCPDYTASLDAAVALVERMDANHCWRINKYSEKMACVLARGRIWATVGIPGDQEEGVGATPALALLIALFSALEAREGE